jgi:S-adenosylhomocysteine hydrolase
MLRLTVRALHPRIASALKAFEHEEIPNEVPQELPLLDEFREAFPSEQPFANLDVVFIQHQLGPLIARLGAMVDDGLDPERCWFIGIPYSTNDRVRRELSLRGHPEDQLAGLFSDPLACYSDAQSSRVERIMRAVADRSDPQRLLVVDDGAYFARFLKSQKGKEPELLRAFHGTVVVEQTTRGYRFLDEEARDVIKECSLFVVSIARCKTKREVEGPFIGAAVSRATSKVVERKRLAEMKSVAVIGYGTVGAATVDRLVAKATRASIDIVDISPEARKSAALVSPRCNPLAALRDEARYDLIVGCTGYTSLRLEQRKLLADGAYLVSGSSAAVEFNRARFVELADGAPDDEIEILDREKTIRGGIHATIRFRHEGGRTFSFVNAGFPVNFDGRIECLPPRLIQATHCLLYAAALQALRQQEPGLDRIDRQTDSWLHERAIAAL